MTNVGRNLVLFRTATFKYIFKYGQKISRPEGERNSKRELFNFSDFDRSEEKLCPEKSN